jgi:peptidylprolyl isomerase
MPVAKKGDRVSVHYTGRFDDGSVFDSSHGGEPLEFTVGAGEMIPGFDEAVTGMTSGETKTVVIPAAQAYGERSPEMIFEADRKHLPPELNPEIGEQLTLQQPGGRPFQVLVVGVSDASITFDANHPLAGQDLTFEISLVTVGGEK